MRVGDFKRGWTSLRQSGFTLIEVMITVMVIGIMILGLYGGISFAFNEVKMVRENERATQILQERMEMVRLLNWDQVANMPGYIPTTFTVPFSATTNGGVVSDGGLTYTGAVTVSTPVIVETYANDLKMITIKLNWTSGKIARQRQMTTLVSQYGLQRYVY
jgi:prepilin-type N-terminal cleavage/methylation domain-containing protein